MKKIAILLPCFNEGNLIKEFCNAVIQHIHKQNYLFDIIFINDASTDSTIEKIQSIATDYRNINIILLNLKFNMGHQNAIYQGFLFLQQHSFDHAIIMDSDGEDDPAAIEHLLAASNNDLVQVVRKKRQENRIFKTAYTFYKSLTKMLIGKTINFGNYSLVAPKLVHSAVENTFVHLAAFLNNQRCTKAKIEWDRTKRLSGSSKMNFKSLFYHGINSYVENADSLLFFFVKLSFMLLVAILFFVLLVLYYKFFTDKAAVGWASSLIATLFNSMLICVGIFVTGALQMNLMSKKGSYKKGIFFEDKYIVQNWR